MNPFHKLRYTLIASLTLLLVGCGGSSNTLSDADKAKMQRAETQTAALKTAYDAAVATLETLEDDTSDATQAEVDDAQAKLDALKMAITAAVDVSDEVKAMYPAAALETRLTTARGSAAPALAAEQARMERAEMQTTALKTAYDAAIAALETLEDDTSDATQAEVDDAQAKLDALKAAITAAMDVSEEVKAMYLADALEERLTTARGSAAPALADEQAKMARAETQTTALKMAYDEARAALDKLKDNTDDATQQEVNDAREKLRVLKEKIAEAPDVSDEVKEMYSAEDIETELAETEKLAGFGLTMERLRMAASKAIEDAGKEMGDAQTAIEGAETAIEDLNIIRIQTGDGNYMVAQDVEKARMAYDTAKAAYDAAREKYEMDREGADTIARMNALSVAAEQARKDAEEAKEAAKTARMKAETDVETLNRTALRYDNDSGMYKVGDASIMHGAPEQLIETTTEDGKTQSRWIGTSTTEYKISAHTAKAPSSSQPTIEARALPVGNETDSSDDMARLKLMDRYTGEKTVNMFVERPTGRTTLTSTAITDENPNGTLTIKGATVKVERATGEFYFARDTGDHFSTTDVSSETIGEDQTEDQNEREITGFYYYIAPSDGEIHGKIRKKGDKVWLRRTGSETSFATITIKYRPVSVAENIKFPATKDYQHMHYGTWAVLKDEEGHKDNVIPADLNDVTAFVRPLKADSMTTVADMPKTGTATWHGHWVGNARAAHAEGTGAITHVTGGSKMTATFGTAMTIKVELMKDDTDMFATLNGKIMGNRFHDDETVTNEVTVNNAVGGVKAGGKFTGSFSGAFFGPEAVETGGVFDYTSEGGKGGQFKGAFGGRDIKNL